MFPDSGIFGFSGNMIRAEKGRKGIPTVQGLGFMLHGSTMDMGRGAVDFPGIQSELYSTN